HKQHDHAEPERVLVPSLVGICLFGCQAVDESNQILSFLRTGEHTHEDGDDKANRKCNPCNVESLAHARVVFVELRDPSSFSSGNSETMHERCCAGAGDQPPECAVSRCALPEHSEEEGGEQRRIHEPENELQQIHDAVVSSCYVCGGD